MTVLQLATSAMGALLLLAIAAGSLGRIASAAWGTKLLKRTAEAAAVFVAAALLFSWLWGLGR